MAINSEQHRPCYEERPSCLSAVFPLPAVAGGGRGGYRRGHRARRRQPCARGVGHGAPAPPGQFACGRTGHGGAGHLRVRGRGAGALCGAGELCGLCDTGAGGQPCGRHVAGAPGAGRPSARGARPRRGPRRGPPARGRGRRRHAGLQRFGLSCARGVGARRAHRTPARRRGGRRRHHHGGRQAGHPFPCQRQGLLQGRPAGGHEEPAGRHGAQGQDLRQAERLHRADRHRRRRGRDRDGCAAETRTQRELGEQRQRRACHARPL